MLQALHIENLAVIKSADIDFGKGLNCLTGETGSGKTLIVGSLNLLFGGKVSKDLIRTGEKRAMVSAMFTDVPDSVLKAAEELGVSCEDHSILLQKTIESTGRTNVRINGAVVTVAMHREIGQKLLSIHGQNDNLHLLQKGNQLSSLDQFADNGALLSSYAEAYAELKRLETEREELNHDEAEAIRLREILTYQIHDIERVHLVVGEEEKNEQKLLQLRNAEKIRKQLSFAYYLLQGSDKAAATLVVDKANESLRRIDKLQPDIVPITEKLDALLVEIESIADEINSMLPSDEDETALIDRLEGRLDAITKLKKKYGSTIEEVLAFKTEAENRLSAIESADERLAELSEAINAQTKIVLCIGEQLGEKREKAARQAETAIMKELAFLDMPSVLFEIRVSHTGRIAPNGLDEVDFMIATNKGEKMSPLAETASGGELARVMLALRCVLNAKQNVDVSVYDEVDTGISGKTARKVGLKLKEISGSGQVICVTHSAQIASLADEHFRVSKTSDGERTQTKISLLNDEERVDEIARILGGMEVTAAQREAAKDMITEGQG